MPEPRYLAALTCIRDALRDSHEGLTPASVISLLSIAEHGLAAHDDPTAERLRDMLAHNNAADLANELVEQMKALKACRARLAEAEALLDKADSKSILPDWLSDEIRSFLAAGDPDA